MVNHKCMEARDCQLTTFLIADQHFFFLEICMAYLHGGHTCHVSSFSTVGRDRFWSLFLTLTFVKIYRPIILYSVLQTGFVFYTLGLSSG